MKEIGKKDFCAGLILFSAYFLIGLPLYASNKLLDYIKIIGSINIFHILFGIAIVCILMSSLKSGNGIKVMKFDLFVIVFAAILIIQAYAGMENNYSQTILLRDCNFYFFPIMIYVSFRWLFGKYKIDIYSIENFFLSAQAVCAVLNFVMYLTRSWSFWGISSYANGRYGGSYMGAFIFTSGYAAYLLINHIEYFNRIFLYSYLVIGFIGVLLGQSRTLLIFSVCSTVAAMIVSVQQTGKKKLNKKKLLVFLLSIVFGLFLIIALLSSSAPIVERLSSFSDISSDSSFLVRVGIFERNIKLIKQFPFGLGLGYEFGAYDAMGNQWGDTTTAFVDCSYLTIAVKLGIIAMVVYLGLTILPIVIFRKNYRNIRNNLFRYVYLSFLLGLIFSTLLSAQSLNAYASATIIWILIAYVITYRVKIENMVPIKMTINYKVGK